MTNIKFQRVSSFKRGTLLGLLKDAYSFNNQYEQYFIEDWKEFDDFFYDNIEIADKCGIITTVDNEPIGFISWDPRNRPEYAEIGHNCIAARHKGNGYGRLQLQEAVNRIMKSDFKKIVVTTNEDLAPAQRMYEGVGFKKVGRRENTGVLEFSGEYIDYEYIIKTK